MLGRYLHFKGGIYTLLHVGFHHDTHEQFAVYRNERGVVWLRPLAEFNGLVPLEGYPEPVARFVYLGPSDPDHGYHGPG